MRETFSRIDQPASCVDDTHPASHRGPSMMAFMASLCCVNGVHAAAYWGTLTTTTIRNDVVDISTVS